MLVHISPGEINVYLHISFLYTISLGWCIVMQTSIDAVETHWEHNDSRGGYVQLLLKKERSTIAVQALTIIIAFSLRPLCAPAAIMWRCRTPAATATSRRSHYALIRTPSDGVCFGHAQSARRRSAFYAIPPHSLAMPLRCRGDACDSTARRSAFCIFLGRRGNAALV